MAKSLIAIVFLQIFFTICLSEEIVSNEDSCKILVDEHDRAAMYSRNFIGGRSNRWPNGIVPYTISSSFSASDRKVILNSIQHITERTCVKFVAKTNQSNYLDIFTGGTSCYAFLGYNSRRSRSIVHLESPGCFSFSAVVHELLHILGFAHEQTRPDRDEYVQINWNNIKKGKYGNFWRALGENEAGNIPYCGNVGIDQYDNCTSGVRASTFGLAYDYGSIMHYGPHFFTKNRKSTITLKKATSVLPPNKWGMTTLDVQKIKVAYECQGSTTTQASTKSPGSTITPASTSKPCVDTLTVCNQYKSQCGKIPFIDHHCKKTCFNCVCENNLDDESCSKLKNHCRYTFIKNFCKKVCKKC